VVIQPCGREIEERDGARYFHQMQRVDDPDAASRHPVLDCLRVYQAGVHAGGRRHEPGTQVGGRGGRIPFVPRQFVGGGERGNNPPQPHHEFGVPGEVAGVRHPVALDVGAAGILRVRPPVVAFGEEIVLARGAARRGRRRNRQRPLRQKAVCRSEHPRTLEGREIQ